jgi:Na+-driven multidrug efflux pump
MENIFLNLFVLYLYFGVPADYFCSSLAAILRVIDKESICMIVKVISLYGIGLPLSIYLAFYENMKVIGTWTGFIISCLLASVGFGFILYRADL